MKVNKKSILTTGLAVTLAAATLIGGGTYAYLKDDTAPVVNTFKTNNVLVDLTETGKNGEPVKERDDYNIIPGTSQAKDPKVTVNATVDSYVYVEVIDATDGLVTYEIDEEWTKLDGVPNVYYREVGGSTEKQEFYVLKDNTVTYDAALENKDMLDKDGKLKEDIKLTFTAYAIQKDAFTGLVFPTQDAVTAKAALTAGHSIVLSGDIDFDKYEENSNASSLYVNSKKSVTIDLNGKTITGRSNSKYFNTIKATSNGTVITINGDGKVIGGSAANSSSSNNAIEATNKGKVIINGGTYTVGPDKNGNGNAVVFSNGGDIVINGGFFYTDTPYDGKYWLLNKQDGSKGSITVYGGTFVNFDPSDAGTEPAGQGNNFVAGGYKVVTEKRENGDTWYTVVPEDTD